MLQQLYPCPQEISISCSNCAQLDYQKYSISPSPQKEFDLSDGQEEWVVGIAVAAAAVGAALGGCISNNFGRKPTLIVASLFFSAGSVLLFTANSYLALVAGRAVLGLGVGLASMSVPAYIAESSPAHLRGRLVTAFGATITLGAD